MVFRVDIDKWKRGGKGCTYLLDDSGQMCCLGFAEIQCGADRAAILNQAQPEFLDQPKRAVGVLVRSDGNNTAFANSAISINDDGYIDDPERMKLLRVLAKKHGHRFIFTKGSKKK